jgi:hypothetical protein
MDLLQRKNSHGLGRLPEAADVCRRAALGHTAQSAGEAQADLRALCASTYEVHRELQRERGQGGADGREILRARDRYKS